ncbi:MAG: hypothetical protein IIY36_09250 [Lachnospiraceae bacterium]|nr:hypothetical protein [Lachnospiraceae bacterium]
MKKKTVTMITVIALTLCAALTLAACGSRGSEEPAQTQAQTEAAAETEAAPETTAPETAAPQTEAPQSEAAPETPAAPDAQPAPADDPYVGTYVETQGERATMVIEYYEGMYYVTVDWSSGPEDHSHWTFHGHFDDDGVLEYFNGLKTVDQPDDSGDLIPVMQYNYGAGTIRMTADGIVWDDEQEHAADGLVFAAE